jgi:hypothetical protein
MINCDEQWNGLELKRSGYVNSLNRQHAFVVNFKELENKIISSFDYLVRAGFVYSKYYSYEIETKDDSSKIFNLIGFDHRFSLFKDTTHIIFTISLNDGFFGTFNVSIIYNKMFKDLLFYGCGVDNIENRIEIAGFDFLDLDLKAFDINDYLTKIGNRPELLLFPFRFTCPICSLGKFEILKPNKNVKCKECNSRFKCDSNGSIIIL